MRVQRLKICAARLALLGSLGFASGCAEDIPTTIAGPLVPRGDVRTFEVFLDASQYLAFDTAFSGYLKPFETLVLIAAKQFEGVVDANTLAKLAKAPASIQVRDSAGQVRTDTLPRFPSGAVIVKIDTLGSSGNGTVGVYRIGEQWDAFSAKWRFRVDTGGVQLPWSTPGGTRAGLIGTAAWTSSVDSLVFPVDSQQIATWMAQDDTTRGALVAVDQTTSPTGTRIRISSVTLRLDAKSSIRRDTTVIVNIEGLINTFVSTPDAPTVSSTIRVAGVPTWRTFLVLRESLGDVTVPCPETPTCRVPLRDVHINVAELLLRPTASPAGFSPEVSIDIDARIAVEGGGNIPLSRTPVTTEVLGGLRAPIPKTRFVANDTGPEIELPITLLFAALVSDTTAADSPQRPPRRIALLTIPEARSFGFATFRPEPRLRLILTTAGDRR